MADEIPQDVIDEFMEGLEEEAQSYETDMVAAFRAKGPPPKPLNPTQAAAMEGALESVETTDEARAILESFAR